MSTANMMFGVLDPVQIIARARQLNEIHRSPVSRALARREQVATGNAAVVAGIGAIVLGIIAARAAAGWYIGKQFDRPKSGAAVGAIFGAPGMGVLSLFPGDK
jgi:hypothetical protein